MQDRASRQTARAEKLAEIARYLTTMTALDADAAMNEAGDILDEGDEPKASMILDGMRAGIAQAREADAGARVVAVWFDGWGSRTTFSWDGNEPAGEDLHEAITAAISSAMRANGEAATLPADQEGRDDG